MVAIVYIIKSMSFPEDQSSVDFRQYLLILKKHWLATAVVASSVFGFTVFSTYREKPVYESQGKILFNKTNRTSALTDLSEKAGALSGLAQNNPLETEAEILRSNPIIEKTIANLQLKDSQGKPLGIDALLSQLKIKSLAGTDVLMLSYRSTNPQEPATVLNALMASYLENNIRSNRSEATAARKFLIKQLPQIEAKVRESALALRRFKEVNKVVALEAEAQAGVAKLSGLSDQITKAEADLADNNTRSKALQDELGLKRQQAVALTNLNQSTSVQQVLGEYQKVQDQLAVERTRLQDKHPTIVNLVEKQAALKKQLQLRVAQTVGDGQSVPEKKLQFGQLKQSLTATLEQVDIERLASKKRIDVLTEAYSLNQQRLTALPRLEQMQLQLERELKLAQLTYEQLQKRMQEVQLLENQNVGNAQVLSEALTGGRISPVVSRNLAVGGFAAILLGLGAALILEAMDKSLKTAEEAKRLLGYPVLGRIPYLAQTAGGKGTLDLPMRDDPYSPASAAFEMLQGNLGFTVSDRELKVIVVSSTTVGEGKSFVAANLAVVKAQLGQRVLLIDADMRRPRQSMIWNLPNLQGLSNVLVNKIEFQPAAQSAMVNLDVLTAGTIPPNPAALLDSQRMATLIKEVAKNYDFVIIDTPPLTLFPDGLTLSKQADGILLLVRPGMVQSDAASITKSLLEQSGQRVLGMVLNGVAGGTKYGGYYYKQEGRGSERNGKGNFQMPKIRVS